MARPFSYIEQSRNSGPAVLRLPHAPVLDGLRALAIIIVYLSHSGLGKVVPGGLGVTIFFFLSGFLITSLLRVEYAKFGSIDLIAFSIRRILRIVPPLWITLSIVGVLTFAGFAEHQTSVLGVVGQALSLSNYFDLLHFDGLPYLPLWSLSVEEHFYLIFPIFFLIIANSTAISAQIQWCIAICIAVLGARIYHVVMLNDVYWTYSLSHLRIDSIVFGCVLALWNNPLIDKDAYKPDTKAVALASALLVATLLYRSIFFRETFRYSLQGLALLIIFSACLQSTGAVKHILSHPFLGRIGRYSYTIYLIHNFFTSFFAYNVTHESWLVAGILAIVPTWAYASAMHNLVEQRMAKLRGSLGRSFAKRAVLESLALNELSQNPTQ